MRKEEEFLSWYNEIVEKAGLTDKRYPVKGMNVWTPYGWKAMFLIDQITRRLCEERGYQEVNFPLLIPETEFKKEADHIKGFGNEVYWVTHGGDDKLDVVIGENDQFVHVFTNDGSWTRTQFADLSVIRNTRTNYVRIGDIDGDGFDDVMLATNDGDVLYYRHLQGTGWSLEIVDNLTRRINTIDIGDVDRGVIFDKSGKLQ